tara:strand:+ start:41 stop:604 length:564 start_codon:yes stop_codon:yes gene_type:complete
MADLIIKPSVGTDNKLIIQNQAGNAVLTTDNSGVTLTNANLANANNVYPAGHTLQTLIFYDSTQYSLASTAWQDIGHSGSITVGSGNKVLIQFSVHVHLVSAGSGIGWMILRDDGDGYDGLYSSPTNYYIYSAGANTRTSFSMNFIDTPGNTDGTSYKIQLRGYNTNTTLVNDEGSRTHMTLTEIVG